jgi:hypothetical protein
LARALDEVIDSLPFDQQDEIAAAAIQLIDVEITISGLDSLATEAKPHRRGGKSAAARQP